MTLTPGQAGDNPQLASLLTRHSRNGARVSAAGRQGLLPRLHPQLPAATPIPHTIPERSDQIARRQAKGSHGGRPPGFDPTTYRQRNTIERGFNRLKHWRGVATRYDKYALTFLGGVTLAAVVTYHRIHN